MTAHEPTRIEAVFAASGAVAAAASMAYCLFSVLAVYPRPAPPGPWREAVVFNLVLYGAFGLHHSVFARERVRDAVSGVVGAPLERALYVWTASLGLTALCWLWRPVPGTAWDATGMAALPFRLCQIGGALLAWRAARVVDARNLVGLGQPGPPPPATPAAEASVRASGPYRWVRHPMYLGVLLVVWAVPVMTATGFVFATATATYVAAAVPFEERAMRRRAPAAYGAFTRSVRWRLLPRIY